MAILKRFQTVLTVSCGVAQKTIQSIMRSIVNAGRTGGNASRIRTVQKAIYVKIMFANREKLKER